MQQGDEDFVQLVQTFEETQRAYQALVADYPALAEYEQLHNKLAVLDMGMRDIPDKHPELVAEQEQKKQAVRIADEQARTTMAVHGLRGFYELGIGKSVINWGVRQAQGAWGTAALVAQEFTADDKWTWADEWTHKAIRYLDPGRYSWSTKPSPFQRNVMTLTADVSGYQVDISR